MIAMVERMRIATDMLVAAQQSSSSALEDERAKVAALEAEKAALEGQLSREKGRAEVERDRAEAAEAQVAALAQQLQAERARAEKAEGLLGQAGTYLDHAARQDEIIREGEGAQQLLRQ